MIYRWREGTRVKNLKPYVAAKEINRLSKKLHRGVRPHDLLESARDPASPLHAAFEWDNTVAAEKWRLSQASCILVSIEIVEKDDAGKDKFEPVRAFVRTQRGEEKPSYQPIAEAMADSVTRAQVLKVAKAEAKSWAQRYKRYEEFANVVAAIDEVAGA